MIVFSRFTPCGPAPSGLADSSRRMIGLTGGIADVVQSLVLLVSRSLPTRGHLDSIKRLMKGDLYIGRGCRQRSFGSQQVRKSVQGGSARESKSH